MTCSMMRECCGAASRATAHWASPGGDAPRLPASLARCRRMWLPRETAQRPWHDADGGGKEALRRPAGFSVASGSDASSEASAC